VTTFLTPVAAPQNPSIPIGQGHFGRANGKQVTILGANGMPHYVASNRNVAAFHVELPTPEAPSNDLMGPPQPCEDDEGNSRELS
jgi:hypothetical protein